MGYNGFDSGMEVFDGFLIAVEQKLPCHIRITGSDSSNSTSYSLLYDIAFDGEHFHATTFMSDGSYINDIAMPDRNAIPKLTEYAYDYLIEYKEQTTTKGDYYLLLAHTPTMTQDEFHDDTIEKLIIVHHFYYR
jgi:hypothetical protein